MTSTVDAPTKQADQTKQATRTSPIAQVEAAFPEKAGLLRKTIPLWANYFRVNYHDPNKSNYIVQSHFVHVDNYSVEEMK